MLKVFLSLRNGNLQTTVYRVPKGIIPSGHKLEDTYWNLLEEEFKPRANKLISIIELWSKSKQNSTPLNEWITKIYTMVHPCDCPAPAKDRIINDVLFLNSRSNSAKDRIIRKNLRQNDII